LLLETLCPGAILAGDRRPGCEDILAYRAQGETLGEIGVLFGQPRNATCVAYVHPRPADEQPDPVGDRWRWKTARVELVRIPKGVFHDLLTEHSSIKGKLAREAEEKAKETALLRYRPAWEDSNVLRSPEFDRQGLIQGQKLMLIDLDRCTRCDECVKACVNTHDDGRTRLFLDGERYGKYLVPTTCRACLDPV